MGSGQDCGGHGPEAQGLGEVAGPGGGDQQQQQQQQKHQQRGPPKGPQEKTRFESIEEDAPQAQQSKPEAKARAKGKAKAKATPPPNPKPPPCKIGFGTPMGLCRVWGTPGLSFGRRGAMGGPSAK